MSIGKTSILVAGKAADAEALVLSAPISFWGGVDPKSGRIADVRHPEHGQSIAGRVLCLPVAVELDREAQKQLAGHRVTVSEDGTIGLSA